VDRITEKTTKAFCMGHPALVMGNPGAIAQMTRLGFQDWDHVLDRTADAVADPAKRFAAIIAELLRQVAALRSDPASWLDRTREVSSWNIRHAFGGGLLARYIALHDVPIMRRLRALIGL
jgi:hypothetical protein